MCSVLLPVSAPELVWSPQSCPPGTRPLGSGTHRSVWLLNDKMTTQSQPSKGECTRLGAGRNTGFSFFVYTVTLICGITISPVHYEFQNVVLPYSWYHLRMPVSNLLPKTCPWFSVSSAVTMGTVAHRLLFLWPALFWLMTPLFTQMSAQTPPSPAPPCAETCLSH